MVLQMNIVGLDIAKSGFQINGSESPGEAVPPERRTLQNRPGLLSQLSM
jgi:hypothetical protein